MRRAVAFRPAASRPVPRRAVNLLTRAMADTGGNGNGARPKVTIAVMKAALAAANVPTAGLLERAEFEALYWQLQDGGGSGAGWDERGALLPSPESVSCAHLLWLAEVRKRGGGSVCAQARWWLGVPEARIMWRHGAH